MMDVYIIGGGASGVLCAIEASKKHRVHIIEKNDKLMKKLLITGNGTCNFSNVSLYDKNKYKDKYNNDFFIKTLDTFTCQNLLDYLSNIGICYLTKTKYNETYIYPYDSSSKSIYYNLYDVLKNRNVDIIYNNEVIDIKKDNEKYILYTNKEKYMADVVVVSTGGKSYSKTGSDGKMLDIMEKMGLDIIEPIPSLCPLYHNDIDMKNLKGIRTECNVKAIVDNIICYKEYGEVQFNDDNISGIPILNASCKIGRYIYDNNEVYISIDFIQNIKDKDLLYKRKYDLSYKYIRDFLCGIVDNKIANIIYKKLNINNTEKRKVDTLSDIDIQNIYDKLHNFNIKITRLSGYDIAQVTKGGVSIDEIDYKTFMSKKYKNMYIIGELIDVDGVCGGYNLSYAFISGILSGKNITKL